MQYEKNTGINTIYKPDDLNIDQFIFQFVIIFKLI